MPTKRPVEVLTVAEVALLMKGCSTRCPTGLRNRAVIVCLWRCGLRVSEALSLHPKDFDAARGTLRVLRGKGDKARTVGIDPQAAAVIGQWLAERKRLGISARGPLFCTLQGQPVSRIYVRNLLVRLAHKAGIMKRVHPHGLRHTHATELLEEGASVGIISKQLGHGSIATTARYLDHISPKAVVDFVAARRW